MSRGGENSCLFQWLSLQREEISYLEALITLLLVSNWPTCLWCRERYALIDLVLASPSTNGKRDVAVPRPTRSAPGPGWGSFPEAQECWQEWWITAQRWGSLRQKKRVKGVWGRLCPEGHGGGGGAEEGKWRRAWSLAAPTELNSASGTKGWWALYRSPSGGAPVATAAWL